MLLDLARDFADWLGDLFDNQAFVLVVGLALAYVAERMRESRQRAEDHRQRRIEKTEEETLQLQLALAETLHGAMSANVANARAEGANVMRQVGLFPGSVFDAIPNLADQPWYQSWLASLRMAGALTARIRDPELKRRAETAMTALNRVDPGREDGFEKRLKTATDAVIKANERAGELHQELMSDAPSPWHRLFWRRSN